MYVNLCCVSLSRRTSKNDNQPREESPPEGGVTTETADLWCKDTTFLVTCQ